MSRRVLWHRTDYKYLLWLILAFQFPLSPPWLENAYDLLRDFGPTVVNTLLALLVGNISVAFRFLLEDKYSSNSLT